MFARQGVQGSKHARQLLRQNADVGHERVQGHSKSIIHQQWIKWDGLWLRTAWKEREHSFEIEFISQGTNTQFIAASQIVGQEEGHRYASYTERCWPQSVWRHTRRRAWGGPPAILQVKRCPSRQVRVPRPQLDQPQLVLARSASLPNKEQQKMINEIKVMTSDLPRELK